MPDQLPLQCIEVAADTCCYTMHGLPYLPLTWPAISPTSHMTRARLHCLLPTPAALPCLTGDHSQAQHSAVQIRAPWFPADPCCCALADRRAVAKLRMVLSEHMRHLLTLDARKEDGQPELNKTMSHMHGGPLPTLGAPLQPQVAIHELSLALSEHKRPLPPGLVELADNSTNALANGGVTAASTGSEAACAAVALACQQLVSRPSSLFVDGSPAALQTGECWHSIPACRALPDLMTCSPASI